MNLFTQLIQAHCVNEILYTSLYFPGGGLGMRVIAVTNRDDPHAVELEPANDLFTFNLIT